MGEAIIHGLQVCVLSIWEYCPIYICSPMTKYFSILVWRFIVHWISKLQTSD